MVDKKSAIYRTKVALFRSNLLGFYSYNMAFQLAVVLAQKPSQPPLPDTPTESSICYHETGLYAGKQNWTETNTTCARWDDTTFPRGRHAYYYSEFWPFSA